MSNTNTQNTGKFQMQQPFGVFQCAASRPPPPISRPDSLKNRLPMQTAFQAALFCRQPAHLN